jgi:hypothetical protein
MTLGQIIDHCRKSYNAAEGDDFFKDAWFITTIWRAESELALEGWVIEKTFTTPSVSGTRTLAWPSNCLSIKEVRYDYEELDLDRLDADPKTSTSDPTGTPTSYAIWDNYIYLFPTPDVSADTIQIRCFMAPDQLTASTDPLNVPDEYQVQLIDYILAQMAIKDQNMTLANAYLQKWEQTVNRVRAQRRKRLRAHKNLVVKDVYFGVDGRIGVFADGRKYW